MEVFHTTGDITKVQVLVKVNQILNLLAQVPDRIGVPVSGSPLVHLLLPVRHSDRASARVKVLAMDSPTV